MNVVGIDTFGEQHFMDVLQTLSDTSTDRNRDWFPALIKSYQRYLHWTFLLNGSELVAFAGVQQFGERTYRLLTRTYIYPDYRRFFLPADDLVDSPATYLVKYQLSQVGEYSSLFVSLEHLQRRPSIIRLARKLSRATGLGWQAPPMMYQTCPNADSPNCWQNIAYHGDLPVLETMSYEDYILKFKATERDVQS